MFTKVRSIVESWYESSARSLVRPTGEPPAGVRHQSIELWTLLLGSGDPQVYVFAYAAPRSIRSSQTNWLRLALLMESGSSRARHFKGGNFRQSLGAKKLSQPLYAVHVVSVGTWV